MLIAQEVCNVNVIYFLCIDILSLLYVYAMYLFKGFS